MRRESATDSEAERIEALEARCERLENEKRRLERLLDALDDTVFVFDPETGQPLIWNRAFREASASTDEEIAKSQAPNDWYEPEDLQRADAALQKLATTGRTRTQLSLLSRDGRRIPTEYHATILEDFDGSRRAAVSVGRDVSEHLSQRSSLERNEALIHALVHLSPAPTWISDPTGTMIEIDEALCTMLQVRPEDVVGTYNIFNDPNLTDPEKMAAVRRVFEEGKPTALLNTYTASNLAARTSVERATFHVSVSIFPLEDAQGQITHVVFQHIDLTELMVAEAAQRKIEQKYRALVESIPDPLVMLNYELDHVLVNDAAVQAAGMSRDQLMETNYLDMYPNRRDHPFYQAVTRVLETREQETVTAQWNFEDAGDRWAQLSIYPVPEGVLFFARDVSEYKAMEGRLLQFQTMEAIGTLAGGVAHDFNNLLTGVRGHAALMAMDLPDSHPGQEHCQGIEELVQSASALTQQLLGLARGGKYQAQPTDANELLARTVTMFSRTRKQLMIRSTYAEDLWTVTVDRSQFEQVVLNLLVNAWQAMPSGGDLFVETKNRELDESFVAPFELKPGRYVQLSVTDAGVGMDDETLARVFEPFFTTREKGRGTGLGLASSYGIVRNHGGVIVASSERGKGSTFDVYVPATEASQVEDAGRDEGPSESGSETVLVIDDEDAVREITTQLLEHLGYRVFAASTGAAGIALFESSHDAIDLVILDMILPGENPGEILAALRDVSDAVKVLLCSGYSLDGEANDLLAHGCQGFLQKPYPLATLADSVRKALDA